MPAETRTMTNIEAKREQQQEDKEEQEEKQQQQQPQRQQQDEKEEEAKQQQQQPEMQQQEEEEEKKQQQAATRRLFPSIRFLVACFGFLGTTVVFLLRVNMSFAIVCMVSSTNSSGDANESTPSSQAAAESLDWDRSAQGQVLSGYFIGYTLPQIAAGVLAQRFGAKLLIGCMMVLASVSTLLMPPAAAFSWQLALALRIVTGLGSAVVIPGLVQLMSHWSPPLERSKMLSFCYAGAPVGIITVMPLSSLLCDTIGWQYIFYCCGGCGLLWALCWFLLVFDTPQQHPLISKAERQFIQQSLIGHVPEKGTARLPLLRIATSLPFWAIVVSITAYDWGNFTFLTYLPTYMKDVYSFSLSTNALYSSLPYAGLYVVQLAAAWLADWLRASQRLSTTSTRKLMTGFSTLAPAAILCGLGFVDSSQWQLAMAMLTVGISLTGVIFGGAMVNVLDVAPRYSGTLFAVSYTTAAIAGIAAPNVVSALVRNGLQSEWRLVFFETAGVFLLSCVVYSIFASGQLQPWAAVSDGCDVEMPMPDAKEQSVAEENDDTSARVA